MSVFNICPVDTCPVANSDRAVYMERIQVLLLKSDFNIYDLDQLLDFVVASRQQDASCTTSVALRSENETTARDRLCLLHHARYDSMSVSTKIWFMRLLEQILQVKIHDYDDVIVNNMKNSEYRKLDDFKTEVTRSKYSRNNTLYLVIFAVFTSIILIVGSAFVCKLFVGPLAVSANPGAAFFIPAPSQTPLSVPERAAHASP